MSVPVQKKALMILRINLMSHDGKPILIEE
jgi:hypothetical protein